MKIRRMAKKVYNSFVCFTAQTSPRAAPGVSPDERDTMRHSEHAKSRDALWGGAVRKVPEHAQVVYYLYLCSGVLTLVVCARRLWASQPPGTVSGHTKGGVHSPRSSRDVHGHRRRVAAATRVSHRS